MLVDSIALVSAVYVSRYSASYCITWIPCTVVQWCEITTLCIEDHSIMHLLVRVLYEWMDAEVKHR